ncbi:Pilin accessory protein (PilO) [Escherichia coli]|nr:Pilin accessory protein (PilO) [Escherichia coli]
MTDISPTEQQVFPLTAGRNVFLAGMDWKTLPASHKNPRTFARSLGAVRYISCEYLSTEDTDRHIMVQPSARIHSPKAAAGISLSPCLSCPCSSQEDTLSLNCHRQTILNFMVFVSAVDGILVSDLVGTREEISEAREIFLTINSAPEHGWTCYEPPSCLTGLTAEVPLPLENSDRCREISGRSTPSPRIPWATAYSGITHTHPSGYCMVWLAVL